MPATYPLALRTVMRDSKARSQPAAFGVAEPRRGKGYVREIGTDTPVFWDVHFRFTRAEAVIFRLWFNFTINRGIDTWLLPIDTEFGLQQHEVQFLPDSLLDTSQAGEVFTYKATIMARAEVIPQAYEDAADLIVALPDWTTWAALLDQAMTAEMPT